MAVRPVVRLPDLAIKKPSLPVGPLSGRHVALAADLVDTMRASPACVGLAAPQIGRHLRAFALDVSNHPKTSNHHGEFVMFDPVVVLADGEDLVREGCMSVPDFTGDVARPDHVVVEGLGLDGKQLRIETAGFEARALLHEIDHLDGLLFLDRVASPSDVFKRRVYR